MEGDGYLRVLSLDKVANDGGWDYSLEERYNSSCRVSFSFDCSIVGGEGVSLLGVGTQRCPQAGIQRRPWASQFEDAAR